MTPWRQQYVEAVASHHDSQPDIIFHIHVYLIHLSHNIHLFVNVTVHACSFQIWNFTTFKQNIELIFPFRKIWRVIIQCTPELTGFISELKKSLQNSIVFSNNSRLVSDWNSFIHFVKLNYRRRDYIHFNIRC